MKYVAFMVIFIAGVFVIGSKASKDAKIRSLCYGFLVMTPAMGDMAGINFFSNEHYRGPDRGLELTFTEMVALGLLYSQSLGNFIDRHRPKKMAPVMMLIIIYAILGTAGLSGALQPLFGFFTVIKFLRIGAVYAITWSAATGEKDPSVFYTGIRRGYMASLYFVGYFALKQKFVNHFYRVYGPFDHSNTIPLFINPVSPVLLVWALGDERLSAVEFLLMLGAVGTGMISILATQSRLGIALNVLTLAGGFVIANRLKLTKRSKAIIVVFIALVAVAFSMVADTLIDRFKNAPPESEMAREEFEVAAKMMVRDKVLGVGLNNFSETMTKVDKYRAHVVVMATEESAGVVHNVYLLSAAETGYIGMVTIIVIYLVNLWTAAIPGLKMMVSRRKKPALPELVALAGAVGQSVLHISGFMEWAFRITPVMGQYFIICGCMSAVWRVRELGCDPFGLETPKAPPSRTTKKGVKK